MHEIFTQVLTNKDLPKAGDLFAVPDHVIANDLTTVIDKIRDIVSLPDYTRNDNDQSVVEICITRVISAIRETLSVEAHSVALVNLLQTCLNYNLRPTSRGHDPPHAKIASDVLSCIFLNYHKKEVMKLALPVAAKFLHKGNKELSRNMTSYLSLAAIHAADLLAQHVQPILDSIISGNYTLSRVLLQIYTVQKEPIEEHVMTLVSLLPHCESADKLGFLMLFSLIAKEKPALLEPSLPQLVDGLGASDTSMATLQIFAELSAWNPGAFTEYLGKLKLIAEQHQACLHLALLIIARVGRISKDRAKSSIDYVAQHLFKVESKNLGPIIREVQILCNHYPALLTEHLLFAISKCSDRSNAATRECIQQLKNEFNEIRNTNVNHTPGGVTIVRVNGSASRDLPAGSRSELNMGGIFSTNVNKGYSKYQKNPDACKNARGLVSSANRSMPKLNAFPHSAGPNALSKSNMRIPSMHRSITVLSQPSRPYSAHIQPFSSVMASYMGGSRLTPLVPPHSNLIFPLHTGAVNSAKSVSSSIGTLRDIQEAPSSGAAPNGINSEASTMPISQTPKPKEFSNHISSYEVNAKPAPMLASPPTSQPPGSLPITPGRTVPISLPVEPSSQSCNKLCNQRISVFEPYPMRDTVQHFCEKHLDKVKSYMQKVFVKLPLPVRCGIEERKSQKIAKLYFGCQEKGIYCLYNTHLFNMKTRNPTLWIHLMFLSLQAKSSTALSTREAHVSSLKNCWDILKCENRSFIALVTSAFPSAKDLDLLMHELRNERFFDVFEYNGVEQQWGCFLCNHPDRARGFVEDTPVIEGQLKEKKSKWKVFRKWRTRYFTLSGAHLSYRSEEDKVSDKGGIDVHQIRSVKVNRSRQIPKAFEIFTDNKSFMLKAKDSSNAEEWVRCLSVAVAHSQARQNPSHHSPTRAPHTSIPRNFMYRTSVAASRTRII